MGAAVSVIPSMDKPPLKSMLFKLQAANSLSIETYGNKFFTLNIGMRRDFSWSFTYVNVKTSY